MLSRGAKGSVPIEETPQSAHLTGQVRDGWSRANNSALDCFVYDSVSAGEDSAGRRNWRRLDRPAPFWQKPIATGGSGGNTHSRPADLKSLNLTEETPHEAVGRAGVRITVRDARGRGHAAGGR